MKNIFEQLENCKTLAELETKATKLGYNVEPSTIFNKRTGKWLLALTKIGCPRVALTRSIIDAIGKGQIKL
jgi:regulator of RNase E activity RraB